MTLVKDDSGRLHRVIASARRVDHNERMIGDDKVSLRAVATGALDEAFAVMRAPGIDAFAALVGQRRNSSFAEKSAEPAGQISADHVPILRERRPARDKLREDCGASGKAALQRILKVQQAEVILATFSHDDGRRSVFALGRPRAPTLATQLPLQVLCECRYPHCATGCP